MSMLGMLEDTIKSHWLMAFDVFTLMSKKQAKMNYCETIHPIYKTKKQEKCPDNKFVSL